MNSKHKNPRLHLRKEYIRTLALANLSVVFGGDLTTHSKETQLLDKHDTRSVLNNAQPTGCD